MLERKKPEADLRSYYTVFWQIGMVTTLLVFIIAVKMEFTGNPSQEYVLDEQEVIEMEEIIQTQHIETPPPPPRPPVPVAVPDDEVFDEIDFQIDTELSLGGALDLPPAPPQEEEPEEDFFVIVENPPNLIGGMDGLNVEYPEMARRAGIHGMVVVQFIVNEEGHVENPVVIRGIGGGADQAAIRAIQQARFTPGMQRGRPVRVRMSLPINFTLQN